MNKLKKVIALPLLATFALGIFTPSVQARQVYVTEDDGVHAPAFFLNIDDTSDDFADLNFGTTSGAQLRYNVVDDDFTLNKNLDLATNELQNFKLERLAVAPTCDASNEGRMYFNTTSSETFVCDGTVFAVLENQAIDTADLEDDAVTSAKILDETITADDLAPNSVQDSEIDYTAVTLNDFTNDAGFLTTVDISANTNLAAGTGATLTGDSISVDLGTSIATGEIQNNAVDGTKIALGSDIAGDVMYYNGTDWTRLGIGTAGQVLQTNVGATAPEWAASAGGSFTGLSDTNFAGLASGNIVTYDGSEWDNVAMNGDASIDGTGALSLATSSVQDAEIDYTAVTLADFTNDAGFLTTVDISANTNLAAGTGATLTGDSISVDLGTSIDNTEIENGTIVAADLNLTDIDLADFTNAPGFLTTVDISANTNLAAGTGATLTGDSISVDLGTSIDSSEIDLNTIVADDIATGGVDSAEIATNAVNDDEINYTNVTLADFTNDSGYLTTVDISANTNLAAGTGATLTGDSISVDLGTSIATGEIEANAVDGTKIALGSDIAGDVMYYNGTDWTRLGIGTAGQVLQTNVGATAPEWAASAGGSFTGLSDTNFAGLAAGNIVTYDGSEWDNVAMSGDASIAGTGALSLATSSVQDAEIDYTAVTLADFTNDAGYLTTVDISADTNLAAGTGATLVGDTLNVDLGTTIETGEITDGTILAGDFADGSVNGGLAGVITDASITADDLGANSVSDSEINYTAVTLADFTNDSGYLTTVDVSADTNLTAGTGATLTGDSISVDLGISIDSSEIDLNTIVADDIATGAVDTDEIATDAVQDAEIDYTAVTLADFTNDVGFVTTDNDTTYSAGTGINLVGTTFSSTLGTGIGIGEIDNGGNNQVLTTTGAGVPQWENKSNFATAAQGTLADSALQSGDNVSALTNDAGYVTTDNDTTYTGSGGVTLTGTDFTADLGTSIDSSEIDLNTIVADDIATGGVDSAEIATNAVNDDEINYTNVTLSDFTNDAGFLTTVDISADTNLVGGTGATLVGDTLNVDLGTTIETGEITNGTITFADLNNTDITLADFTNDAGFVTTDNDTTYTGGTGITLTGTVFSNDLGTDIDVSEIISAGVGDANKLLTTDGAGVPQWENKSNFATAAQGTLADSALQSGDNVSVLTNDAGYVTTDNDTTYTASGGVTLTGTNFTNDLGTSIDASELDANAVQDSELDYTAVTLADFTNDAGFVTTDNDTTYTGSGGVTLTGTDFTADLGTSIDSSEIDLNTIVADDIATGGVDSAEIATNAVNDDEINYTNVTLADFTNDAGYLTTVDISADTNLVGGTGVTLTGDTLSADLGTSISNGEIDANAVDGTKISLGSDAAGDVMYYNGTDWTRLGIGTAGQVLQTNVGATAPEWAASAGGSFIGLSDTNFAGLATGNIVTYDGSEWDNVAMSGDATISAAGALTFGSNTVQDAEIDYTAVTLADFTNDSGYLTTVDISANTNLAAGTGATLTGDSISVDLGTSIDSSEIDLNTIVADDIATGGVDTDEIATDAVQDAEIDYTAVTLADFTNDSGYLTTVDISADTNLVAGVGATLTGDSISVDLGTSIATGEIEANAVDGSKIALGSDTAGDIMYYNGTDWGRLVAGSAGTYLTTGATPSWDNIDTLQDADGNTQIQVEEGGNDDTIRFDTNGAEQMIIDNTGNVLIGAAAETIANASYVPDGDDLFVAGDLGVEGPIYTDATAIKYQFVDIYGCVRGSASAGTVAGGQSAVIRFDSGGNSQMRCSVPVPDDWVSGTDINIETYWSPSDNTAGDIDFDLSYALFAVGETVGSGSFTDTIPGATYETVTVSTQLDIYEMIGDIPAAAIALDDMINFRLRRSPGDAGDTYAGDTNIHMVRMAYTGKRLE